MSVTGRRVFTLLVLTAALLAIGAVQSSSVFELGVSYTYIHNKNQSDSQSPIRDIPNHKAFAYVNWNPTAQWGVVASMDAEIGRYYSYSNNKETVFAKMSGFATFGLQGQPTVFKG